MSGPKAFGYRVISEKERARREAAARQARCAKYVSRVKGLIAIADDLGISCCSPKHPPKGRSYEAEDERLLLQKIEELKRLISEEQEERRVRHLRNELSEMVRAGERNSVGLTEDDYMANARKNSPTSTEEAIILQAIFLAQRELRRAEILAQQEMKHAEILESTSSLNQLYGAYSPGALPQLNDLEKTGVEDESGSFWGKVHPVVDAIAKLGDDGVRESAHDRLMGIANLTDRSLAEGELLSLKNWIHAALEAEAWAELASSEVEKIEHLQSDLADKARSISGSVTTKDAYEELKTAVSKALDEYNRNEDMEYVQRALCEALESLGFVVGEEFTATDYGEVGVVRHPVAPNYGIRIQSNSNAPQIFSRVVSFSDTSPEEDIRAESETCPLIYSLVSEMNQSGVRMTLETEKSPGECTVEQYNDQALSVRGRGSVHAFGGERMLQ